MRDGLKRKNISMAEWKNIAMKKTEWRKAIRAPSACAAKKTNKFENWLSAPKNLLGCTVEKQFGQKWYEGEIVDCDIDADTSEVMWEVLYDDGDRADYNCKQLDKILCDEF